MRQRLFSKTIAISCLSHLAVFSLFSFSFGNRISQMPASFVSFRGGILRNSDLRQAPLNNTEPTEAKKIFSENTPVPKQREKTDIVLTFTFSKPSFQVDSRQEKKEFRNSFDLLKFSSPTKKESAVMFYPVLPYHFPLYFKDRQMVHIELSYSVSSGQAHKSIIIQRRISSGNLEADLLCMRYISRYLFLRQTGFMPDVEHNIKIDLQLKK